MNLFNTTMTAVDDDNVTTCEKKKLSWSSGLKGIMSDKFRANLKAHNTGKKLSLETRAKMSASHTGTNKSAETRAKIAAGAKARWAKQKEAK
jgi:hypothetical protein